LLLLIVVDVVVFGGGEGMRTWLWARARKVGCDGIAGRGRDGGRQFFAPRI